MSKQAPVKQRLKVGDCVREIGGKEIGTVVHIMRRAGLIVVNFPPSREGIAYHPDDLVKL
jgi:hypothetical protein